MTPLILAACLAAPPCAECEAMKTQAAAPSVAAAQPVRATVAVVRTAVCNSVAAASTLAPRGRLVGRIRAGDGPVRRLVRSLRAGCR